ncbi:hypothetical protein JAAARDRAFT_51913, partial [Jaapia argillacea MUCL 33604]
LINSSTATLAQTSIFVISKPKPTENAQPGAPPPRPPKIRVDWYYWTHPKLQPNGTPIALQCSKCKNLRKWRIVQDAGPRKPVIMECDGCRFRVVYDVPAGTVSTLKLEGQWLKETM